MALANATFSEILDDLSSRFIINVPEEELASIERICFQIEQAHWFYEDFVREQNPNLPSFNLKNFSAKYILAFKILKLISNLNHEKAFADFMQYKIRVPVCGAIMLNDKMDQTLYAKSIPQKCVLVKGWSSRSGWGFPKGKINKDEPDSTCAAREVLEETGYDISPLIKEQDYVELTIREQRIRLYIAVGVPENTEFCPRTRKEISKVEWHKVADLPTWIRSRDRDTPYRCGGGCVKYGSSRFYMVVPFVSKLRNWLKMQKKLNRKRIAGTEESSEVTIFNNHTDLGQKETSPETSVPGTESEGSPQEQSPNFSEYLRQPSPRDHDTSHNIMKTILGIDTSNSNPSYLQKHRPSERINYDDDLTVTPNRFTHTHSYPSTSLPLNQSSIIPNTSIINAHLPYNQSTLATGQQYDKASAMVKSGTKPSITSVYPNSHTSVPTNDKRDITAPIPIRANSNVSIAALDSEQRLRRNSLLSLFTAPTSTKEVTPVTSKVIDSDAQRRNSLLSVLQSDAPTSNGSRKTSLTHEDIVQHRMQQSLFNYLPNSYNSVNPPDSESKLEDQVGNGDFTMFQHEITQGNTMFTTTTSGTNNDSNLMKNRRDSAFSRHSSQEIQTPKLSTNVGHIGQGRPSSNNKDNVNPEIREVSRKMSLLGLCSAKYSSNDSKNSPTTHKPTVVNPVKSQNTFFSASVLSHDHSPDINANPGTSGIPSSLRANNESLLRLITASPPQGNYFSPKVFDAEIQAQERALLNLLKLGSPSNEGIVNSSSPAPGNNGSSISQDYNLSVDEFNQTKVEPFCTEGEKDNSFMADYIVNLNSNDGKLSDHETSIIYPSTTSLTEITPNLGVRHEHLNRIHTFIPPGDTLPQEGMGLDGKHYRYGENPMTGFKFDVEKIVAVL
ncbi:5284_t:CDS:2 [Acaulospora morrowiae]|uniref:5284_t:CDS:1 n=1 Tax=Acaulospora morrowiae TaxID=94023 RepID=A0A9N8ZLY5_9GLOM|nr:5284_t:CDS:2 [Acaulospora morrowiae]